MFKKLIIAVTMLLAATAATAAEDCNVLGKNFHDKALADGYVPAAREMLTPDILQVVYAKPDGSAYRGALLLRNNAKVPPAPEGIEITGEDSCIYKGKESVQVIYFQVVKKTVAKD